MLTARRELYSEAVGLGSNLLKIKKKEKEEKKKEKEQRKNEKKRRKRKNKKQFKLMKCR